MQVGEVSSSIGQIAEPIGQRASVDFFASRWIAHLGLCPLLKQYAKIVSRAPRFREVISARYRLTIVFGERSCEKTHENEIMDTRIVG
jgi:hypothetical protein